MLSLDPTLWIRQPTDGFMIAADLRLRGEGEGGGVNGFLKAVEEEFNTR